MIGGPDLRAGRSNKTPKARALFPAGSSEICPYRTCRPTDPKFLAHVTEPELLVIASLVPLFVNTMTYFKRANR
jgi:hypothetical protein